MAPALIISIAGNLYLTSTLRKQRTREDKRWEKLGRLQSISMLYLAETYPTLTNKKEETTMFSMFAKKSKTPTVDIKTPWSNRSKILLGLTVAAACGTGVSIYHDLKIAADETIPESAIDQMLTDDAAAGDVEVTTF